MRSKLGIDFEIMLVICFSIISENVICVYYINEENIICKEQIFQQHYKTPLPPLNFHIISFHYLPFQYFIAVLSTL